MKGCTRLCGGATKAEGVIVVKLEEEALAMMFGNGEESRDGNACIKWKNSHLSVAKYCVRTWGSIVLAESASVKYPPDAVSRTDGQLFLARDFEGTLRCLGTCVCVLCLYLPAFILEAKAYQA